ncbi:MAG TPA: DNA mismatch repair endonuclease MutL, partial [Kiloniellaceae bacterium]|nr:DNA mismatch repair endonuclease MutL [Kiloniellaceae bacterium]
MPIRRLPETLVNQIAAGEVVERPAAAVKELVENALDAGARHIDVELRDGGRALIAVTDDGCGMTPDELLLAVERHATSKLPDDDLVHIASLGFRGEALPSIGAVARLTVTSRTAEADAAWSLAVEGGRVGQPAPAAHPKGTRVEVRDLFFATPARLKFLKTARSETMHVQDTLARLAMAHPAVGFTLGAIEQTGGERRLLSLAPAEGDLFAGRLKRLGALMGREFADNALPIEARRESLTLTGYAGLPTLNRGNAQHQYLFVNGRPVRDKLLYGALRGAYQDFLARDRHPLVALFLELPPEEVDVNVHPAKAEVRFRDPGLVRGLIVSALKHALAEAGHRAATTVSGQALGAFRPQSQPGYQAGGQAGWGAPLRTTLPRGLAEATAAYHAPLPAAGSATLPGLDRAPAAVAANAQAIAREASAEVERYPLGAARAQLHGTYVVAQTADGIVIVDQHAAHERLVYERMKQQLGDSGVKRQLLLLPEVVELDEPAAQRLAERAKELEELGLVLEPFGPGAVVVREVPALLGEVDVRGLVQDLADELAELGEALALKERLEQVCG